MKHIDVNELDRTRSISDDDLCASCRHCDYNPGSLSLCLSANIVPDWEGQSDDFGYVQSCPDYLALSPSDVRLLDELHDLSELPATFGQKLTRPQASRCREMVETLKSRGVVIPSWYKAMGAPHE